MILTLTDLLANRAPGELTFLPEGKSLLVPVAEALEKLRAEAARDGFDLKVCSAYRSFEDQKKIWELKAKGQRKLLDVHENELNFEELTSEEILQAILRWSAIPGASRHHWGTDIDVFDGRFISQSQLRLVTSEYEGNGPCAEFNRWLTEQIDQQQSSGFIRPYEKDLGGVSPEPWHLSYAPLAKKFESAFDEKFFIELVSKLDISLVELIRKQQADIYHRYIGQYFSGS